MFKIDSVGATPGGEFQPADSTTGAAATRVSYQWLNAVQREILNVITAGGGTPSKANDAQLRDAIAAMIAAATPSGGGGTGVTVKTVANLAARNALTGTLPGDVAVLTDTFDTYMRKTTGAANADSGWTLISRNKDNAGLYGGPIYSITSGQTDYVLPEHNGALYLCNFSAMLNGTQTWVAAFDIIPYGLVTIIDVGGNFASLDVRVGILNGATQTIDTTVLNTNFGRWDFKADASGKNWKRVTLPSLGSGVTQTPTVQTRAIVGATTTPNVFVRQTKTGKLINITVSGLSDVVKDTNSGPIKVAIDAEYLPEDLVAFIKPAKVGGTYGAHYFQVTPGGYLEMYSGPGGSWIAPGTSACGWSGNLSFSYSIY